MPELPEVETIVRQIRPHILNRHISNIDILRPDQWVSPEAARIYIVGSKIENVFRKGKFIIIQLTSNSSLAIHLRMTGKLCWKKGPLKSYKYDRTIFFLNDESRIHFNDTRALGTLEIVAHDEFEQRFKKYGPDPFSEEFTQELLKHIISKSAMQIKDFLMDQTKIAGIGNIYANEILFHSNINPMRRADNLSDFEIIRLYRNISKILSTAILNMGTTLGNKISDYRNVYEMNGNYQAFLHVYGRKNEACRICQHKIIRIVQKGRSSFYCPSCQPFKSTD